MPFKIDISSNSKQLEKSFRTVKKGIFRTIENSIDEVLKKAILELKTQLKTYVTQEIKIQSQIDSVERLPDEINIPVAKADIVKEIFGYDIRDSNFIRAQLKNKTNNDLNNLFVVKNNRLKVWQGLNSSSTLQGELDRFKERIRSGIIMDYDSGKFYVPNPDTVADVKLDCSRDTGETLDSQKKFDAYKNSDKISRRGNGPDQRVAAITMKQDAVKELMGNAIPVDQVIDDIMDGKYADAMETLDKYNKTGAFTQAIERIEEFGEGKAISPDSQAFNNLLQMVNSLKVKKIKLKDGFDYVLTGEVPNLQIGESTERYLSNLKEQISMWLVTVEPRIVSNVIKRIKNLIKQFEGKL